MNLVLHHWRKFGRILLNHNTWFGCCHNGGRFSPQCTFFEFRTRVRVISWYEKALNPTRREGWRLWLSIWPLVICASWHSSLSRWSNCFVIANIKRDEPPFPKDSAHLFELNWGLTVHRQHSFYLQLYSVFMRCQELYAGIDITQMKSYSFAEYTARSKSSCSSNVLPIEFSHHVTNIALIYVFSCSFAVMTKCK